MGGAVSAGEDNDELIDNLLEADYIKTGPVERVFRAVDRADYYTEEFRQNAYKDLAWKQGNLHLSAPCVYSEVVESLKLEPGLSFLNLGSGTGYLSTMVGLLIGPNGLNHGIEFHEDVVQYAYQKLEEFKQQSPAVDEYEFCEPQFVVGNCLCLHPNARKYDRVYCGAACPEQFEQYMKELLKIGGVLVMPLNDQLLQVTRCSEASWEVKTVLPVSFASLIMPKVAGGGGGEYSPQMAAAEQHVKLPEASPLTMQEVCRYTIRALLRKCIETEHPDVKADQLRRRPRRPKKPAKQGIVIPILEEGSDNEDGAGASSGGGGRQGGEDGEVGGGGREGGSGGGGARGRRSNVLFAVHQDPSQQFSSFIQLARAIAVRNRARATASQEQQNENARQQPQSGNGPLPDWFPRRRNIDSGLGDEEEAMDVDVAANSSAPAVDEPSEAQNNTADNNNGARSNGQKGNKRSLSEGDQVDEDSDFEDDKAEGRDGNDSPQSQPKGRKFRASQEKADEEECVEISDDDDVETEDDDEQDSSGLSLRTHPPFYCHEARSTRPRTRSQHLLSHSCHPPPNPPHREPPISKYTAHMRAKISALPLPWSLKSYLNYYREF